METDWEDEDEKTTVFDRSHEESAQALLQMSPTPAAGAPATLTGMGKPRPNAPVVKPPPVSLAASPPISSIPTGTGALSASAQLSSPPQTPMSTAPSVPAMSPSIASNPAAQPSFASSPQMSPMTAAPPSSKTGLFVGIGLTAVAAVAAFAFLGGPGTGGLVVSVGGPGGTAVSGVKVLIDGEEKCADSTCKIADLEPGSYVVKAVASGYKEMAGKAYEVKAGEQTPINLELVPDGGGTGLKVSSEASGLTLTVDGKKIGPLPQSLSGIEPGSHKIEISGSDLIKPYEKTINVVAGEMFELKPELELAMGNLIVKLGDNADDAKVALTVNGSRKSLQAQLKDGETEKIKIPADGKRYAISATKKGYEDFEQEVTFTVEEPVRTITISMNKEGDEEETPSAPSRGPAIAPRPVAASDPAPSPDPAPKPAPSGTGKININSIPVSTVILDGRPLGSTPQIGVSVSAGSHTVVFVHPQHGRKIRQVNVAAGGTGTAAVRFP